MYRLTSFIIAETSRAKRGKELPPQPPVKSAPHYFEKAVPSQLVVGEEAAKVNGRDIKFLIKTYHPDAILVEATVELQKVFEEGVLELKDQLHEISYGIAKKYGAKDEPAEEYAVYQISDYDGDPELFIHGNEGLVTSLLKSEKLKLDEKEIEHTLAYQLKYAKDDLAIVDWDGALLFDPQGEFEETIELLELANYQLLRYRILDGALDGRLQKVSKFFSN